MAVAPKNAFAEAVKVCVLVPEATTIESPLATLPLSAATGSDVIAPPVLSALERLTEIGAEHMPLAFSGLEPLPSQQ